MALDHAHMQAEILTAIKTSLDTQISSISGMADSYARPYLDKIAHGLWADLWKAGFTIVPTVSPATVTKVKHD